jgi:hypothetical protein
MMTWQDCGIVVCTTLAIIGGICWIDEWRIRRRDRRVFRINPMYRVGQDAKDRL